LRIERESFSLETELGEIAIRTARRGWMPFLAVQVHLIGYKTTGNKWCLMQICDKTFWQRRP